MKHTELPWKIRNESYNGEFDQTTIHIARDCKFSEIAGIVDVFGLSSEYKEVKANAEFIVKACNNYERIEAENKKLIEELEGIKRLLELGRGDQISYVSIYDLLSDIKG